MKKITICCLSSLLMLSLIGGIGALKSKDISSKNKHNNNQTKQATMVDFSKYSKNLTYDLSEDGTYYIVSNNNHGLTDTDVVIPEEYEGLPVKEIANDGFAYRNWINSVAIPKTIERIGAGAFNNTGLKKVYYNAANCADFNGRNWVFYHDTGVQDIAITFGRDVERIPANFFAPLSTDPSMIPVVNSVTFEEGSVLEEIGPNAFFQLSNIKTVNFPESLKKIGDRAFYGTGLKEMVLPDGLEVIGDSCFANNIDLKTFNFPTSLKELGKGSFLNCVSLTKLDINSDVTINKDTFKYCSSLEKININKVKTIDEGAFGNCTNLKELILGDSIEIINKAAFKDCAKLESVTLPESLKELGDQAFYGCYNVNNLVINSIELQDLTPGNAVFYGLGKNTTGVKVTFGNEVKVIPANLLSSYSLETYIPNVSDIVINGGSLEKINEWAFGHVQANVTFVGKISEWKDIEILEGNMVLSKINCVKEVL